MVIREQVVIPSLTGEKERCSYVYLPVGYGEIKERRYPVLYMFDGHNLFTDEEATFGKCWGLEKFLDENKVPLIVAAVECNHEGNCRLSEYSPVDFDFHGQKVKGRGKRYMDWLVTSFKPTVDENYRTLPDRANTFIAGSSMGGLMTLYALSKYGKYFSRGAALSPSLWVQNGNVPSFIANASFKNDTVLFTDYGSKEFKNHSPQRELFGETFRILCAKGVAVTARIVLGGTHCEASWEKEIPYFLRTLLG
ncbi:MAG: alpha/beta hydrolase-fold protein [Clostridiales bacterium]|nr:alpha/beta hydrolase-fold protein [Clostridiales bacterium]